MQSFCRLCAVEKPHLIPIFSKNSLDISSKIINLLKIPLNEDDYLPLTICTECFSKLNLFNVFKTSCLEAQEVLSFIFIAKKPVEETISKYEEIIDVTIEEEEEIEDESIPIKTDIKNDEDETEDLAMTDENDEVLRDEIEMIDEEYLNDSYTENEKDDEQDDETGYEIELLDSNECDSEDANDDGLDFTTKPFNKKHPGLFCPECSTFFEKRKIYEAHFKEIHDAKPYFSCQICLKTFTLYRSYTRHVVAHAGPKFKCDVCDKLFLQKIGLHQHLLSHLDDKFYKCDQCDRSFKQNSSLYNHKANAHNENIKHTCDVCHKLFATAAVLSDHVKSKHSSIKDVICDICGDEHYSRSAMFYHKLSHKPKSHECEICFLKFKTNSQLKQHRLKNRCALGHILEEELFGCEYDQCFKKFITRTDLDLHLIKHHNDTFSFEA